MMPRLGILGGGEAAKMIAQAAGKLAIEAVIFSPDADSPARQVTPHYLVGDYREEALLRQFAEMCDIVTLENDFADVEMLRQMESFGTLVYPKPETIATTQNKLTQKRTLQAANIDVPRFLPVQIATDVMQAVETFGFPLMLKSRRNSTDGTGNAMIHRSADIPTALEKLAGRELMAEAYVSFVRELVVIGVRGQNGDMRLYPVLEMHQQNNICHIVLCPAGIEETTAVKALEMAQKAIETINGIGVFGIEMFELENGDVTLNEIACYPHNAGYLTIEGTITSQFENHVRAVMDLPLGDVDQIAPATAMINILGDRSGTPSATAIKEALAIGGAHIHLYGKHDVRPGRKMGHITVLGYTADGAEKVGRLALSKIRF